MLQGEEPCFFLCLGCVDERTLARELVTEEIVFLLPENTKVENYISDVNWSNSEATVLYSTLQFIIPGALRQHFPLEFKYTLSWDAYNPLQNNKAE